MTELGDSLARMSFMQLLLLFAFVTSYMLALGGMLGNAARSRAALLALALAFGFAALTDPWVHGALLMAFVVAGLGLFVVLTWLLARLLGPTPASAAVEESRRSSFDAEGAPSRSLDSLPGTTDLGSRAGVSR